MIVPHEPLAFTKIAFEGGLYELSWKPPIESKDITNYTIFWCDNERDRPYQCTVRTVFSFRYSQKIFICD
jgi:hypothetical protein